MSIGRRIRELREQSGFSQEDLGDLLGVTRSSVSLWEKGRSLPTPQNLKAVAAALGVSRKYLTKGKGRTPPLRVPPVPFRRDSMMRFQRLVMTGALDDTLRELGYEQKK